MILVQDLVKGVKGRGKSMLDIHSHILPNVDDGSRDMEESIEMARIYLDNGVDKVIATPHYIEGAENSTKDENLRALEKLRETLSNNGLDLKVYLGNEVYFTMEIINYLKEGKVSTLNDSRYILLELPMYDMPLYTEDLIYELLLNGYIPIIAHPERNLKIMENPNILYELIIQGALAQLNLPSIEGSYGSRVKDTGEILLKHNMIHFVGTDAHSQNKRAPNVEKSLDILNGIVDQKTYKNITYLNGLKIINNEEIMVEGPKKYEGEKNSFAFLKEKVVRIMRNFRDQV